MPIKNRLLKNYKHKIKLAKKWPTDCYRLYEKDIPEFPFIIDIFGKNAVVYYLAKDYDLTGDKKQNPQKVIEAISEILKIDRDCIFIKERKKQKGIKQYLKLSKESVTKIVNENYVKFEVNLSDYLDTGLFLDHRIMRKTIFEQSNHKKFLNLFSYTCSVSVFAAMAGALTTSVDLSQTYLEWGKRNFELNNIYLNDHQFLKKNVSDFLNSNTEKFDLIFLDPPTFSNSKKLKEDFEVEKDQIKLVEACMNTLDTNGVLYFSTNKKSFSLSDKIKQKFTVEDITQQTIPNDFRDKKIHYCFKITI